MLVLKFGGTSVGSAQMIRNVYAIVKDRLPKRPLVVVSAHGGVTDMLIRAANEAVSGGSSIEAIEKRHLEIVHQLDLDEALVSRHLRELEVLLKGITLVKELTPRTLDYVLSFGERLSARTVAAYFTKAGIAAVAVDAYDLGMITDSNFGQARPLPEAEHLIAFNVKRYEALPIITGYIGKDRNGNVTTLGRNGSDLTATAVGAAVGAEEVQIWGDTDGVMTADPTLLPEAMPISLMSFDEAGELAYYGGRIHPSSLVPAMAKRIPVRLLNTRKPTGPGTLIMEKWQPGQGNGKLFAPLLPFKNGTLSSSAGKSAQPQDGTEGRGKPELAVKAVVYKESVFLLNIASTRMLMHHGFMAKLFEIFGRHGVVIDMISTSEVSVSLTTDADIGLEPAVREISEFAEVTVESEKAIVCVVGEGIRTTPGVLADIFVAVRAAGANVHMVSQGASRINVAFVVDNEQILPVVSSLHKRFFPGTAVPPEAPSAEKKAAFA
ncbi:MAG: aspartate kinase [Planctomycetota bacterium]|nr:aspartate kinase [Planctomycetota bacterium]